MKTINLLILTMLIAHVGKTPVLAEDGDDSFWKVDTRTPAHELPEGTAADAVNQRFEDGRPWSRLGVSRQPWGVPEVNIVPTNAMYSNATDEYDISGFMIPGATYKLVWGPNDTYFNFGTAANFQHLSAENGDGSFNKQAVFVYPPGSSYAVFGVGIANNTPVTAKLYLISSNVCAYSRFDDPTTGIDTLVMLTDDWRNLTGEDGGRGRAWKIVCGNGPVQIPMNGNDIYGQARLIACDQALVMLRQGNERHYFNAATAVIAADKIQLNCQPQWSSGDQCLFVMDPSVPGALTGGIFPASGSFVYVSNQGSNQVKLYADAALTQAYTFTGGTGFFYLERRATLPGPGGNGAPPLIAQSNASNDTWDDVGFLEVPAQVYVSAITTETLPDSMGATYSAKVITAPNHRMSAGDSVNFFAANTPMSGTPVNSTNPWYAFPLNSNQLVLYTNQIDALGNTGANTATSSVPAFANGQFVVRTTATNQPMPPGREGFYTATQQLVIVNGANQIYISNPLDPLHFQPLSDQFTANLGDSDQITAVSGISGLDCLIILKTRSVYVLYNFSQGSSNWTLTRVTNQYGCIAPLSVASWGSNLMFLSRRGYDRVIGGAFGLVLAVEAEKATSWDMKKYTDAILWDKAASATATQWNNRLFLALPLKPGLLNQATYGTITLPQSPNNAVLCLNFLNSAPAQDKFGWEGVWLGPTLSPYAWAVHPIAGEDRLTFVDFNGNVNWLSDGWQDTVPGQTAPAQVTALFTTRAYFKGQSVNVIKGEVTWDTFAPSITVQLKMAGVSEIETLGEFEYSNTQYQIANAGTYPEQPTQAQWEAPHRADYAPEVNELMVAQLDMFQNTTEPLRARTRGRSPQLVFINTTGSMRLVKTELAAKQIQVRGTMT